MSYLIALAVALPPQPVRASGGPSADAFTTVALGALLLWAILLCWLAVSSRRSAEFLNTVGLQVIARSPLVTRLAVSDPKLPGTLGAAPGPKDKLVPRYWSAPPSLEQSERGALHQRGFTPAQIDRLLLYRRAYRAGHYHADPAAQARLEFARWLYEQGKISG